MPSGGSVLTDYLGTSARLYRRVAAVCLVLSTMDGSSALANDETHRQIAESVAREAREIISTELFGHYDVADLAVLRIEPLHGRAELRQDYGLATAIVAFSTRRNATRHPSLNSAIFEPGSPMCKDWLYLHCGVPVVVPPHWRARSQYSLHGYLLLEGRPREGYVLFPKPPER